MLQIGKNCAFGRSLAVGLNTRGKHAHVRSQKNHMVQRSLVGSQSLSNDDDDGDDDNENGKIGLDQQNNNFARASRFLVNFFAVTVIDYDVKVPTFTFC